MPHGRLEIPAPTTGRNQGPPHFSDPQPRLYGLLAVEVAPGKIAYYHLELDHEPGACTIDLDYETVPLTSDDSLLAMHVSTPMHITATIRGTVVSDQPDYRPPTRTTAVQQPALTAPAAYMVDIDYRPGNAR